ncbi:MAG: tetratricopeptide repeat protein [Desulfobulbaceae bacterium]|nr:tetratricopeptide repeat protein [Desulfobulbaceae bacterium]HIJ79285.1 tetratricopeptide repeat protein [Deltaproteobacteria bacterium]
MTTISTSNHCQPTQESDYSSAQNGHSADNLFRQAMEFHQQGEVEQAFSCYQQVVALEPDHLEACFYLGLLCSSSGALHEAVNWLEKAYGLAPEESAIIYQLGVNLFSLGRTRPAIDAFKKAVALDPGNWQAAYNLGVAYFSCGKFNEAIAAYDKAARCNPQDSDIHFNLGLAWKAAGGYENARLSYLCALETASDDAEIHYNLALVYKELALLDEAITALEIAVALQPQFGEAYGNLGVLYLDKDMIEEAVFCYERLIDLDHNVSSARHILAALKGETTDAAPEAYVRDLFDNFSSRFDERLVNDLQYETPVSLKKLFFNVEGSSAAYGRLLDLGCGTGLVGEIFGDIVNHKTGVDLSPKMIEVAAAKNIYDHFAVASIAEFLEQDTSTYDLIIAADVFVYLGDLESIFPLVLDRLAINGRMLFSTEYLESGGYKLQLTGRYAHSDNYLHNLIHKNGMTIVAKERTNLRKEKGKWIEGELYMLSK